MRQVRDRHRLLLLQRNLGLTRTVLMFMGLTTQALADIRPPEIRCQFWKRFGKK